MTVITTACSVKKKMMSENVLTCSNIRFFEMQIRQVSRCRVEEVLLEENE